ncbi:hypothetical protein Pcinc_041541, partial [Petrolisthes cinctipes]
FRCESWKNLKFQKMSTKIQTFVFLDLEATGLPYDDPRILELSMIAVSRNDLIRMGLEKKSRVRSPSTGLSLSQPAVPVSKSEDGVVEFKRAGSEPAAGIQTALLQW